MVVCIRVLPLVQLNTQQTHSAPLSPFAQGFRDNTYNILTLNRHPLNPSLFFAQGFRDSTYNILTHCRHPLTPPVILCTGLPRQHIQHPHCNRCRWSRYRRSRRQPRHQLRHGQLDRAIHAPHRSYWACWQEGHGGHVPHHGTCALARICVCVCVYLGAVIPVWLLSRAVQGTKVQGGRMCN